MWKKAYKGPFKKTEAMEVAGDIRKVMDVEKNGMIGVAIRKRSNIEKYDVYVKTDEKN